MNFIDFAYQDYKYMEMSPNEELFFDRKLSLGAECCEKLLKQLLLDLSNKTPNKTHSQKTLLHTLIMEYGLNDLRKFRSLSSELTEIYFVRRYPGDGYYILDAQEFDEIYNNTLEFINAILQHITYDNRFRYESVYKPQQHTTKRLNL